MTTASMRASQKSSQADAGALKQQELKEKRLNAAFGLLGRVAEEQRRQIMSDHNVIRNMEKAIVDRCNKVESDNRTTIKALNEKLDQVHEIEKAQQELNQLKMGFRKNVMSIVHSCMDPKLPPDEIVDILLAIALLPNLPKEDLLRAAILSGDADSMDRILQDRSFRFPDELRDLAHRSGNPQIILRAAILSGDADSVDRIIRDTSFVWSDKLCDLACRLGDKEISRVMDERAKEIRERKEQAKKDFDRAIESSQMNDSETGH